MPGQLRGRQLSFRQNSARSHKRRFADCHVRRLLFRQKFCLVNTCLFYRLFDTKKKKELETDREERGGFYVDIEVIRSLLLSVAFLKLTAVLMRFNCIWQ